MRSKLMYGKKVIYEGPGAGYTIDVRGFDLTGTITKIVSVKPTTSMFQMEENKITCEVKYDGVINDFEAESYYYGTNHLNNLSVAADMVEITLSTEEMIDESIISREPESYEELIDIINVNELNQLILDTLRDSVSNFVYGGGWAHSTYDGTVASLDNLLENVYEEIKLSAKLTDTYIIQQIDREVAGNNAVEVYYVDNTDEEFDTLEDAIEYAKQIDAEQVIKMVYFEHLVDDGASIDYEDYVDSEIVWENEEL